MPVYLTGSQANPSLVPHSTAKPLRSLVTRACLAIDVARRMNHQDVSKRLAELFANGACWLTFGQTTGRTLRLRSQRLPESRWGKDSLHRARQSL